MESRPLVSAVESSCWRCSKVVLSTKSVFISNVMVGVAAYAYPLGVYEASSSEYGYLRATAVALQALSTVHE